MNSLTEVVPAGSTVSRETNIEAVFQDLLSNRNYRFNHWLGISLRLGHRQVRKVVYGLDQILGDPAANHDPERNVHFDRDPHRVSPHF
jgi:hypothetical protein